jgi:hypothetical protein
MILAEAKPGDNILVQGEGRNQFTVLEPDPRFPGRIPIRCRLSTQKSTERGQVRVCHPIVMCFLWPIRPRAAQRRP